MHRKLVAAMQATPAWYNLSSHSQAQAIIAALPDMVKPLQWVDFEGRGAKATAWGKANYLITKWSTNEFELVESYPGYQGDCIGERFYPSIEAAKSAAQKHHTLSAFGIEGDG